MYDAAHRPRLGHGAYEQTAGNHRDFDRWGRGWQAGCRLAELGHAGPHAADPSPAEGCYVHRRERRQIVATIEKEGIMEREASALWQGDVKGGKGTISTATGSLAITQ